VPSRIAVVGSINVDLVALCERLPRPGETVTGATLTEAQGGKGANQAVASARLGASVTLFGCVGSDDRGRATLAGLAEAGVETGAITRVDGPTGVALIVVAQGGENQIVVAPGANLELRPDHIDLGGFDALLTQLEIPVETVAAAAEAADGFVCVNAAPATAVPALVLRRADLVVVNRHELEAIDVAQCGGLVAVTLGEEGALLLEGGEEVARARPPRVDAVDGTAAGDAFCAALVVSLLDGLEREAALRRACAAGAIAASRLGAQPSLPTTAELDAILAET
jgi:ribokinase